MFNQWRKKYNHIYFNSSTHKHINVYLCGMKPSLEQILAEFPPVTKAQWTAQVEKDLKGRPLKDLHWQTSEGLLFDPFGHADDFPTPPAPLVAARASWAVCEHIEAQDPVAANAQALDALQGGAEALSFGLSKPPKSDFFDVLLEGIFLDYVELHFGGPGVVENPGGVLAFLQKKAEQQGVPTQNLRGSLGYDLGDPTIPLKDWRYTADLLAFADEQFPNFRCLCLKTDDDEVGPIGELSNFLKMADLTMTRLIRAGAHADQFARHITFEMSVGKSYFVEVAKLRAFHLLWYNFLKQWKATLVPPHLSVVFKPEAYGDDLYTNMIRATTMAMSGILGGAARLTVLPFDADRADQSQRDPAFGRRIARNVQHLLKMESGLDQFPDPAAGSYYVEQLTGKYAEMAWFDCFTEALQRKAQGGPF